MARLSAFGFRLWARLTRSGPTSFPVHCEWCSMYRPGLEPRVTGWSSVEHNSGICPECKLRVMTEAALDDTGTRGHGDAVQS